MAAETAAVNSRPPLQTEVVVVVGEVVVVELVEEELEEEETYSSHHSAQHSAPTPVKALNEFQQIQPAITISP